MILIKPFFKSNQRDSFEVSIHVI